MEWSLGVESWRGMLELSFGVEWSQSLSLCCSYRFFYNIYGIHTQAKLKGVTQSPFAVLSC